MDIPCRSVISQRVNLVKIGTAVLQSNSIEEVMIESLSPTTGFHNTIVILSCVKIVAEELVASRKKVAVKKLIHCYNVMTYKKEFKQPASVFIIEYDNVQPYLLQWPVQLPYLEITASESSPSPICEPIKYFVRK